MWYSHFLYNNYQANEFGDIRKCVGEDFVNIKQTKTDKGYLIFNINGKSKSSHRFVWECINGEIEEGCVIDHINTNRDDNRIENLRMCTYLENANNELTLQHLRNAITKNKGYKCLKIDKVTGDIVCWYPSISVAARETGADRSRIRRCCEHRQGYYTCVGYRWEYTNEYYTCKWGKWFVTSGPSDNISESVSEEYNSDSGIVLWKCKCSKSKNDYIVIPGRTRIDVMHRLKENLQIYKRYKNESEREIRKIRYAIKHNDMWKCCGSTVFVVE